jgi:hypothetical protein
MLLGPLIPRTVPFFGRFSVGSIYVRGLIAIFAIQALTFAVYQLRHMRRELQRLERETRTRQFRSSGAESVRNPLPEQKGDVWPE